MSSQYRSDFEVPSGISLGKIFWIAISVIAVVFVLFSAGSLVENVDAHEIMVVQALGSGKLTWYTSPGVKWQGFGKVTTYPKQFKFEGESNVTFNDGGTALIKDSIQVEMPLDSAHLTELHTRFGSAEAIEASLVAKVVNKAVTLTAPTMSSRESYAEKKSYLINYVEDQIKNGIYRTAQHEATVKDTLTGQEKTAIVVEIVKVENGTPARQENAVLIDLGLTPSNFSLDSITYDDNVKKQIAEQQAITMAVQTSMAEARQAEQRKFTVEQQGQAEAAKAKWDQEVVKAKYVTEAQQKLEVARLNNETAEQDRQALLKRADGEATYRKKLMEADNALERRLNAQVEIAKANAEALSKMQVPIVPSTVFGDTGGKDNNSAATLLNLLTIQAAKSVGLEK